jgi:hypothetical protein
MNAIVIPLKEALESSKAELNDEVQAGHTLIKCCGPNCQSFLCVDKVADATAVCKACNFITCVKCRKGYQPDHEHSCSETVRVRVGILPFPCVSNTLTPFTPPQDLATRTYLDTNTKDCPGCHIEIEKSAGCDQMTCTQCM